MKIISYNNLGTIIDAFSDTSTVQFSIEPLPLRDSEITLDETVTFTESIMKFRLRTTSYVFQGSFIDIVIPKQFIIPDGSMIVNILSAYLSIIDARLKPIEDFIDENGDSLPVFRVYNFIPGAALAINPGSFIDFELQYLVSPINTAPTDNVRVYIRDS